MSSNLLMAFRRFIESANSALHTQLRESITGLMADLVIEASVNHFVEKLEKGVEFGNLVQEASVAFAGDYHHAKNEKPWRNAIHIFFCRSGYYLDLMDGKGLDVDTAFSSFCRAFEDHETQITFLAPLENVGFHQPSMDLGACRIRRFTEAELEDILQNRINRDFFPWAAIEPKYIRLLSQYWFVEVHNRAPTNQIGSLAIPSSWATKLAFEGYAEREYTDYPEQVEVALRQLCLFDWPSVLKESASKDIASEKKDEDDIWYTFRVPFLLKTNTDWLSAPEYKHIPFYELSTISETNPVTGAEEEVPERYLRLDKSQTQLFIDFVRGLGNIFTSL